METLYQKSRIISSLKKYFEPYMELLTNPTGIKLFMLLLAVLSMQTLTSVRHLHRWFLAGVSKVSLNSYYYLLSYTELPLEKFASVTIRKAVALISESHRKLPVLLLLDDTVQAKFGTKFECWSTMFDHASRSGSSYLSGHCFVALTLCVPVTVGGELRYLNVPVRFRMRGTDESKLTIASEMIRDAMKALAGIPTVILLCDSWYPKGDVLKTVESHDNLELIANVRVDTALYALPELTGKRGRPAKKGARESIHDFAFVPVEGYFMAAKTVMTNLFRNPVYATVTTPNFTNPGAYRLFISTISAEALADIFSAHHLDGKYSQHPWLLPLYLYSIRWKIEVMFYELKTFWSFGRYMIRSKIGVENFVSIISLAYASAVVLPLTDSTFSPLADSSTQTVKYAVGEAVRRDLFFADFENIHVSTIFSATLWKCLNNLAFSA